MDLQNFLNLYRSRQRFIWTVVLTVMLITTALSLVQSLKYRSTLRLLVVQDSSTTTDTYAVMRSTEYLSKILAKVSYSTSFADRVLTDNPNIDRAYFGNTSQQLSKRWQSSLVVMAINETGIIEINGFHPNRDQAEKIARGVGARLISANTDYHGLGTAVKIKLLDDPITSNYPVRPNLLVNLFLALVVGLISSFAWIYLRRTAEFEQETYVNYNHNSDLSQPNMEDKPSISESFQPEADELLPWTENFEPEARIQDLLRQ
ncbi:hypothetical protein COT94_04090 [Candidatus Falkowbacteria bacterium CG10_big_fil_rev_8_21_14_0_10_37_14]|uniref:Polysaccharide chain length determinant N-terminal domain-containing protein n=1 Tax=Candidatus Falkowbacteria bacterium CG10_big_fil_rev_8_21_14_0_10_37_14 TaxID=1974561 RepID=A0A2M6WSF3_9BACT|nr:hypothetical protein [Candidatus Falkowbacteria bacterium]PIT95740.1 MAG: hypothetical protein COT94_04090 [Candidatus Falkowbacteria bacterium CG10_big_fil_rev_8_21_14_0_10_37_14]